MMSSYQPSEYELKRKAKVERNDAKLKELGLIKSDETKVKKSDKTKHSQTKKSAPALSTDRKTRRTRVPFMEDYSNEDESNEDHCNDDIPPSVDGKIEKANTINFASDVVSYTELSVPWLTHLAQFLHYRANGVKSFDPNSDDPIEVRLSEWIKNQHKNYQQLGEGDIPSSVESILKQQTTILQEVKFPFRRSREERRDDYVVKLQEFKEKHGHCRVPQRSKEGEDDGGLGGWVNRIRKEYKKPQGERTLLNYDLEQKLIVLGFEFTIRLTWDDNFNEMKKFAEVNGHCRVNSRYPTLGKWVSKQSTLYNKNELSDDKVDKLNCIGFCWNGKRQNETK